MCSVKKCKNKVSARGLCHKHYQRLRKYGDPFFTKHHGYSFHSLYRVWENIKKRCYNKNRDNYKNYGGRGITVCDEWMNPKVFIEWCLENGWRHGLEIDRRDNDGNYCPENCRFVTHGDNVRNNRLIYKHNTSGYRGVSIKNKKWGASIRINNKLKYLGSFDSPVLAALRYDAESYRLNDGRPMNFL